MHFRNLVLAACLLVAATPARAEQVVPLTIGSTQIQFPVPDAYVLASKESPRFFEVSASALSPELRLVETLVTRRDLQEQVARGQPLNEAYVQVQTMRNLEQVIVGAEEWQDALPGLAQQIGGIDLGKMANALEGGTSERMTRSSGTQVELDIQGTGKPTVYSQADGVLRYSMVMPIRGSVAGEEREVMYYCAAAMLRVEGKVFTINVGQVDQTGSDRTAAVREMLERLVTRVRELNKAG